MAKENVHGTVEVYEFMETVAGELRIDWSKRPLPPQPKPTWEEQLQMGIKGYLVWPESDAIRHFYWLCESAEKKWLASITTPPALLSVVVDWEKVVLALSRPPPASAFGSLSSCNSCMYGHARDHARSIAASQFIHSHLDQCREQTEMELKKTVDLAIQDPDCATWYRLDAVCAQLNRCQHLLSCKNVCLELLIDILPTALIALILPYLDGLLDQHLLL